MGTRQLPHPSVMNTNVRIVPVSGEAQIRKIDAAIAKPAYQIFEKRGGMSWHELEDWRQAEAEVLSKRCFGLTTQDNTIIIGTDVPGFEPGTLEIWLAPRGLTICERCHSFNRRPDKDHPYPTEHMVFRTIQLPRAVDPRLARAKTHGRFLEIRLAIPESKQLAREAGAA